ncbi:MAG: hypothetical protein IIC12_02415 [Proteobacteria bacterium]|nr:hypothetical protein [Pseudomonadota bacterium]
MKRNRGTADTNRPRKQPGMLLDHALYLRFKMAASLRGIRVGAAMDKAMSQYLDREENKI